MGIVILNWRDLAHPKAGGAEVYTHEIAREWVNTGNEVTLYCSAVAGLPTEDEQDGVRIIRQGTELTVYRGARQFYDREGTGRVDVVIDEVNTRPFLCPAFVKDVPVVALIHQIAHDAWFHEF